MVFGEKYFVVILQKYTTFNAIGLGCFLNKFVISHILIDVDRGCYPNIKKNVASWHGNFSLGDWTAQFNRRPKEHVVFGFCSHCLCMYAFMWVDEIS